ncbi:phage tail tape measure protein [Devosia sp. 1635]|uniref:phage tail tape measure protein n=1 Tax=Devosia sp. 1635 TaxID=2726066 RepID=UPI001564BD46|nr:phage tail tape measure protein [Devosia sp. 1635]
MATLQSSLILSLIDRVTAPARGISAAMNGLQGQIAANNQRMAAMQGQLFGAAAAGYALYRGLSAPITAAADFEASMNRVEAALSPTNAEFAALGQLAKDMGRTTQYSVNESALAIEMLAKNGLDAASILGGALKVSMDVAASSGTDLSTAADITTDIMANFKLRADQMSEAANGIAGVLIQSKFGIDDYRLALAQAGGVAGGFGVTLDDFNTSIAATSSYFASGSDAGTSFKTFLQRLVPASKPAARAMRKMGLEFFDANGNMKSMAEISQELKDGLEGLSDQAKNEYLQDIFGTDAIRTAIALAEVGSKEFEDLQAIIKNTSAQEQAAARMKGFWGTVERLKSSLDLLATVVGEALLPAMTRIADALIPIVDRVIAFAEANPILTAALVGTTAALVGLRVAAIAAQFALLWMKGGVLSLGLVAVKAGAGVLALLNPLNLVKNALLALRFAVISTGIGALLVGVAMAGTWIYNNWFGLAEMFTAFGAAFMAAVGPLAPVLQPIIDAVGTLSAQFAGLTGEMNGAAWTQWGAQAGLAVGAFVATAIANFNRLVLAAQSVPARLGQLGSQISAVFSSINLSAIGAQIIQSLWDGIAAKWEEFMAWLRGLPGQIGAVFSGVPGMVGGLFGGGQGNTALSGPATPPAGATGQPGTYGGGFAAGGPIVGGTTYLVGEEGPELITPNRSGFVHTAPQTQAMLGGGRGATISFGNIIIQGGANASAQDIAQEFGRQIREAFSGIQTDTEWGVA